MQCPLRLAKGSNHFLSIIILFFCLLGTLHPVFAQTLTFTTNTFATSLSAPYAVAAADVNGDGKVDLISASGDLNIFTNGGNVAFATNAILPTGGGDFVVTADVNGDGYLDLLTVGNKLIRIYTNNGTGVFGLSSTPAVGGAMEYFTTGDINGDGSPDLISGNFQATSVTILTNDGSGNFGSNATVRIPNPLCVATADVNGDGSVDLVTASTTFNSVMIFTNNGSGVLGSNATLHAGLNPNCLICQDLNGDNKPDIVTANYGDDTLSIFTNNGSGVFGSNATVLLDFPFPGGQGVSCVVAADLNGDGKPDLATVNYLYGHMCIITNNGFGVFGMNGIFNSTIHLTWITAADLNGDGKTDLITANGQADTLTVYLNTSPFPPPNTTPAVNIKTSGAKTIISWPSDSPGWSLQQNPDLTTSNWGPSGYDGYIVDDDGTNKNLVVTPPRGNLFFRLLHP
ncbi:MAG TPA: VCBS repeat-containing protein [Verrucomicrobiae bacterium]|jgi:hypothetical protein|nr:VCBS repeat-containing protein [Verrucomicrobiae bacterium]